IIIMYENICRNNVPFEILNMDLLKKSNEKITLESFFEIFLQGVLATYQPGNSTNNNNQLNNMDSKKWLLELEKYNNTTTSNDMSNLFKGYVTTISIIILLKKKITNDQKDDRI